jgi:hypothetical protein
MNNQRDDLILELQELQKLGVVVSDKCLYNANNIDLSEYNCGVSDLASLFLELYN